MVVLDNNLNGMASVSWGWRSNCLLVTISSGFGRGRRQWRDWQRWL